MHSIEKFDFKQNRYIDNIESLHNRIDLEIEQCNEMNIPLTMVLFSVKNYKRYYNVYGAEELLNIFGRLEAVIRERLSDRDFALRVDRHKVLLILPGKDKRYAVPFANVVRNDLVQKFRKKDMQLLFTFLTSEFPVDGKDFFTLIEAID